MADLIQRITEQKQKRAKVIADQKAILAVAQTEGRSVNTEEDARYNAFDADFLALDTEVRRLEELKGREERTALSQHESTSTGDPDSIGNFQTDTTEAAEKRYGKSFEKYLRHGIANLTKEERADVQRHFAPDKDGEQRTQTVTTSGGGFTIPTGFAGRVEQAMLYYGPMFDPSVCGSLNTKSGNPLNYPTLDGTATKGRKLAINTAVTTTALTFGQVTFDAYKYSSDIILVPVELLEDEEVNLEMVIGDQLGQRLGRIANEQLTIGDGSGDPNGVVTASAAGITAGAVDVFTRDEILGLLHSVDRAYRQGPKVGFMFHDNVLLAIKKMTIGSGDDRPLWQPSIRESEPDRIEGHRYWVNNDMASTVATGAKVMLFGDFSRYLVRRVSTLRMLRLNERYADADQVGFVGFMRLDGDLIAANSIKRLTMA